MHILLRSAHIIDAQSPLNGLVRDVLIENGLIRQIAEAIYAPHGCQIVEFDNLHVSPGWFDLRVSAGDPGLEHKETLTSACRAALAGGFTDMAVLPNTQPVIDSKDTLGYVQRMADGQPVAVHPIAAITKGAKGTDFADMIDLHHAGAIAFSDGDHPLQSADLLLKTLQYLGPMGALLMNRPEETGLTRFGQMHEGVQSTLLGLKGMPAMAEEIMIERDLRLLAYVSDRSSLPLLHFSCLSSGKSVELIRAAKERGMPVSCDVAAHQLAYDDTALAQFDTNLKVNPPFRSRADVAALWAGLADGTIDAIVSDHSPQDDESKQIEFDQAEFGMIGLETAFSVAATHNPGLPLSQLVSALTTRPRHILRLPALTVAEGQPATLTLFDPAAEWTFAKTASRSKNSPFLGQTLTGKVLGTLRAGHLYSV
ncbi:MAG: dihydroorotase [Cytophagales bacterium]|nr:MAG: dihydroorotase [Cytophagales bacterium]